MIKCGICGSENVNRHYDRGYDVHDEGGEQQHLDICEDCGAERFVADWYKFSGGHGTSTGKWRKRGHLNER